MPRDVEREVAELDDRIGKPCPAAGHGLHPGGQFARIGTVGHNVVRAVGQCPGRRGPRPGRHQQNDRRIWSHAAQLLQAGGCLHVGQVCVEQDGVLLGEVGIFQKVGTVFGAGHEKPRLG
ncbi:MAG: hypothetical protein MUE98_07900 [Rhodobacteraceae bacterium]|nr:hypothetical protein [Paracoccaceae bacterium]